MKTKPIFTLWIITFSSVALLGMLPVAADPGKDNPDKADKKEAKADRKDGKGEGTEGRGGKERKDSPSDRDDGPRENRDGGRARNDNENNSDKDRDRGQRPEARQGRAEDRRDHRKEAKQEQREDRKDRAENRERERFEDRDRERMVGYFAKYKNERHGLPPGLAKRWDNGRRLPDGWRDRIVVGHVIESDWYPYFEPVPYSWFPEMVVVPDTRLYWYGDRVVRVYEPRREIVDVVIIPSIHIDL